MGEVKSILILLLGVVLVCTDDALFIEQGGRLIVWPMPVHAKTCLFLLIILLAIDWINSHFGNATQKEKP
jgi:hypothetical protein